MIPQMKKFLISAHKLTLFAQSKHVDTTFDMIFIKFLVSCMTWSTFTNVADFPTVGSFTWNWSVWTYVGTLSKWSSSSFFGWPAGTYVYGRNGKNLIRIEYFKWERTNKDDFSVAILDDTQFQNGLKCETTFSVELIIGINLCNGLSMINHESAREKKKKEFAM